MIDADRPAVILAPMEGVTDAPMRALQGELGGFHFAVTEYFRINQSRPGTKALGRHMPELSNQGRSVTGLPVQMQLLGGDPDRLAQAAEMAYRLGAWGIDLNFGCPAATVNRHDGGATLLKYPHRIRDIVRAVRQALPAAIRVSAKLRLGWDDLAAIDTNADMAAEGGASWLTIHARTRMQGYAPPVYWTRIAQVRRRLGIPIIANGDIWTLDDLRRCRDETGCQHFMLGRGALADPFFPRRAARFLAMGRFEVEESGPIDWHALMTRLVFWTQRLEPRALPRVGLRMKQWLRYAAVHGGFAEFEAVKRCRSADEILELLRARAVPSKGVGYAETQVMRA